MNAARDALEANIAAAHAAGDFATAATLLLEGYGGEIAGYLAATMRNEDDATEAFSRFQEDLWRGLRGFDFRASARTWAYVIAKHAATNLRQRAHRRREVLGDVHNSEHAQKLLHQVRATTAQFLKTDAKDRVRALREQLSADERELLILRIDRGLEWNEIARILRSDGLSSDDAASPLTVDVDPSTRETAALRKRFERIKEKLRRFADAAGMLS